MIRFINREDELGMLENEWRHKGAAFVVLYGRRRVGKSRLIQEFIKNKKGVYFIAEDINKKIQITELKNKIATFFNDTFLMSIELTEWKELFDYLPKVIPKNQKIYLAIDEFSYVIKNDPAILSGLQKLWDTFLAKTQIFLLLSGSLFGMMTERVLSSASPLYGRRTRDILLTPLKHRYANHFLNMPYPEKLKIYFVIGGIPEYLLKAHNYNNADNFFNSEFFKRDGFFYREPYFLLSQEFKEIKTYFTILNAISFGNTKPTEIANFAGVKAREIYPYLENLIRLGLIKKELSILRKRAAAGIYLIKDPMFDFWYNFVYSNRESIEKDIFKPRKENLKNYFGKRFEIFVRDELIHSIVPFKFTKIGKWWHKDKEIDIVALNEQTKQILFAECKWQDKVNAKKIVQELAKKASYVEWHKEKRKESFAIFAKSFKEKIKEFEGKKVYCFDLKDIEKVLRKG